MKDENLALKMAYEDKEEENPVLKRTSKEKEQNTALKENNKQLEAKIKNLRMQLKKGILQVFEELEERNERKNNLIIFVIEEADYTSRQGKIENELDICVQVFEEIQSKVKNEYSGDIQNR